MNVVTNLFDEVEIHRNCTVQILRNTQTGEISVGWWKNRPWPLCWLDRLRGKEPSR